MIDRETQINPTPEPPVPFPKKQWRKWLLVGIIILFSLNNLVLAYDNLQSGSPIFGVKLGNKNLIGLTPNKINDLIIQQFRQIGPLIFTYQNQSVSITPKEIGLSISPSQVYAGILSVGRTGNWATKLLTQEKALLGLVNLPLQPTVNPTSLTLKILDIQDRIETNPQPERPDFANNLNTTLPATSGVRIDVPKLTALISQNIILPGSKTLSLPVSVVNPHRHYSEADLKPLRDQAKLILSQTPATLTAAGLTFTLTPRDLAAMLLASERPDPKNPQNFVLVLRLNEKLLNNKLGDFAAAVEAKNHAEFNYQFSRVAIYAQVFSGKPGPIAVGPANSLALIPKVLGVSTPSGKSVAYLTFDDGPEPTYHPLIVDILKNQGVTATFFLIGRNAQKYPDLVQKTLASGNPINNHSLTHAFLPNLSAGSILEELKDANNVLIPLNRNQPIRLFRPPYGGTNYYVKKDAASLGMREILWNVDPRDWSEPETNELVRRVVENTVNGSIILMHSNHLATVRALPQILTSLKARGFEFQLL